MAERSYKEMLWSPDRPKSMRIVITGMGIVAPGANNVSTYWDNLINGRSALKPLDIDELAKEKGFVGENARYTQDVKLVGRVDVDPVEHMARYGFKVSPVRLKQRYAPEVQILLCSAAEALTQAKVYNLDGTLSKKIDPEEVTVRIGTILGPSLNISRYQNHIEHGIENKRDAMYGVMHIDAQRLSTMTSNYFEFSGGPETSSSACSAGGSVLNGAIADLLLGDAGGVLVGASDLAIHPHLITQLDNTGALSHEDDPTMARPFDKNYKKVFMAEGAAVLYVETMESAEARGATILAEIKGYGKAGEPSDFDPDGKGIKLALKRALRRAGPINLSGKEHGHPHSAGTKGDETEVRSIREARKESGFDESDWAISSSKWNGHPWGPSHLFAAIGEIEALHENVLPPSPYLKDPIADDVDFVQGEARSAKIVRTWVTSQGLGGGAAAHVFELPE